MSVPTLLDPHRDMVTDLLSTAAPLPSSSELPATAPRSQTRGDGLLIMSKGLGVRHVLLAFLQIHADPRNLVFLVNTPSREVEQLQEDLMTVTAARASSAVDVDQVHPGMLKVINNETPANERFGVVAHQLLCKIEVYRNKPSQLDTILLEPCFI